jgi:hypothetical protein
MKQRTWVIEGMANGQWWAMAGHIYDNKRLAFYGLRSIRQQFDGDYPKSYFRLAEYRRIEA